MFIYTKYIFKNILSPLVMISCIVTSLIWIMYTLRMLHLIDKGIELKHFLKMIICLLPFLLFMITPIVVVIAVIYTYHRLQDERQIIIFRGAGLSNYSLAKPALLVGALITIISFYISSHLMPMSYSSMRQDIINFREVYISSSISPKTFNQISKYINVYVDNKNKDGSFNNVVLFDNKIPSNKTILFAKHGRIIRSEHNSTEFELIDGLRHSYDKSGNITKLLFDSLVVAMNSDNLDLTNRSKNSSELYIHEIMWPDPNLSPEKQKRFITDAHSRIIWPLFNFVFVFLSLSIFLKQSCSRKHNIKKFIITFIPILLIVYIHFALQKMSYVNLNYIYFSYINVIFGITIGIYLNNKNNL